MNPQSATANPQPAQPDLPSIAPVDRSDAEALRAALAGGGWHRAPELSHVLSLRTGQPWERGRVNLAARDLGVEIISGGKGYQLRRYSTEAEIDRCANNLMSRGRDMFKHGLRLKRSLEVGRFASKGVA